MAGPKLKITFLIGRLDANTRNTIATICKLENVEISGVLVDTGTPRLGTRYSNLRRNLRREGLLYPFYRALTALRAKLERLADGIVPAREVEELLDRAFPGQTMGSLAKEHQFRVIAVGPLNSSEAIEKLQALGTDLGIVLGTRILKRPLFNIPRLGCINLHKGKVPEYRGTPPGFWELFEGRESAGVTVHFVDDGLDTGDVVGEASVPIHPKETPESLKAKLDEQGTQLLATVVQQIQLGTEIRVPQSRSTRSARRRPTRAETEELARRLPHWRRLSDGRQVVKLILWLATFHSGIFSLLRRIRRDQSRGAILLYHRVNDFSVDVLSTSTRRFAEHLVTLRRYYRLMPTAEMVDNVIAGKRIPATSVAIHFDDCYLDVRANAAPLLAAAEAPAVASISSGFVDTERVFEHDREKYPHRFLNLARSHVRDLPAFGVDVAAHTVNHVDLGKVTLEQAAGEVTESRQHLEQLTGRPVLLFSFPFGKVSNIREEVRELIAAAGYKALFSAHGGFVEKQTERFDIPRLGVSSDHSPLALLMELEGISPAHFRNWLGRRIRRST